MVLVNTNKSLDLSGIPPDEPDPGTEDEDLRMIAITSAINKMEENEKTFYTKRPHDDHSPSFSKPSSVAGTPRHSRPCSMRDNNVNRTILNSAVSLNHKNSAISRSYSSPRQFTLTSSKGYRSANGLFTSSRPSTRRSLKADISTASRTSFDFDLNEDIPLESLRTYKAPPVRVVKTSDIYLRACSFLGITASQSYTKQVMVNREICMANTSLSHHTVKPIAISLVRDYYITLLDVSGNDLGPLGVMYIAEMLVVNDTISEVNLTNTSPGRAGLEALANCLPLNKSVYVLKLESNSLDHTETDYLVKIIKETPRLTELYLGHNNLGYEGAKLLAEELESNTTLRTLDLQWNHFRKQSAAQMCKAIQMNKGLRHLNMAWNGLGKEGCIALAHSLPKNKNLKSLDLTNNRIDVVALPFLLHGMVRNDSLNTLQLAQNPMTTDGAKAVVKAITGADNVKIKHLNIDGIPVDKDFTKLLTKLQDKKDIHVEHGVEMYSAIELEMREHDPHDLNRFDPVMVLIEYMRIDNLRLIDMFGYLDVDGRGLVSKDNLRTGVSTLGLPLTEYHLDCIMHDIDSKKDGYLDLEELMVAQRDMSKVVIKRTTRAKKKGKEDLGLKELRKILKELIEKRNKRNKEKAQSKTGGAWTGAINKVKVMGKLKTIGLERRNSVMPESVHENTDAIVSGEFNTDRTKSLGDLSKSLGDLTKDGETLPPLLLPLINREDTIGLDTFRLNDDDAFESRDQVFHTNRAQIDNFVMDTVREATESSLVDVT